MGRHTVGHPPPLAPLRFTFPRSRLRLQATARAIFSGVQKTLCGFLTWRVPTNGWHRSPTLTAPPRQRGPTRGLLA
eukprot:scaffold15439_cov95-Isochrysis_galbana.AAC.7